MMNIGDYWEDRCRKNPEKTLIYHEGGEISYQEFGAAVNRLASGLFATGIRKGDRVCLMLPNTPEFLTSWFALAKIGAVMVPVNTAFRANEIGYIVDHSEASGFIAGDEYLEVVRQVKNNSRSLKWVAGVGSGNLLCGITSFNQLLCGAPGPVPETDISDDDPSCIIYTSGTTGNPKGVVHTHRTVTLTGEAFLLRAGISAEDRIMAILPLFHQNALFYSTWGTIAAGASIILIRRFSASRFWEQAVRYGVTEFNFVHAIGRILSNRPEEEFRPEHRIKTAIGVGVSPDTYHTFTKRFKIQNVIDAYGLSEIPAVSQNPIGGRVKVGSIGLPAGMPASAARPVEMKVVNERGKEAPAGVRGELIVKSPLMMKEYFQDEEKTREAVKDGWFYTGDYVYRDDEGYFYFVSRKKDIIRRKGENISPAEIENVINAHPKVAETAVIGVPSELGEEEIMACIVLKPEQTIPPKEIAGWCRERLATFKVPRYIQFRGSLPKTATQRVRKHLLRAATGPERHDTDSLPK